MEDQRIIMRCSQADKQLQLYIDKQLSLKQIRRLEMHLSTCSTCQQSLLLLEKIDEALQDIYTVAEPPDLTTDIMRKVALIPPLLKNAPTFSCAHLFRSCWRPSYWLRWLRWQLFSDNHRYAPSCLSPMVTIYFHWRLSIFCICCQISIAGR